MLFVGIDGGGTKTAVCALSAEGRTQAAFSVPGVNYTGADSAQVDAALSALFTRLAAEGVLERTAAVCLCAAGVSRPDVPGRLVRAVRACGYAGPLSIEGDHAAALAGALGEGRGAILLSGTGSICYGRAVCGGQLREKRAGGWGHIMGDEGSGYAIGRAVLQAAARAEDGRGPDTLLRALVLRTLGAADFGGVVAYVYGGADKGRIAALAPLLDEAHDAGDEAAARIAAEAGGQLALLAQPVLTALGLERQRLALGGSILTKSAPVRGETVRALARRFPDLRCVDGAGDAARGAALLAREMQGRAE